VMASIADVVEQIAPTLALRNATVRATAGALIIELLDERRFTRNYVRAAQAERAFALDIFHGYVEPVSALTEPAFRLDAARALRQRQPEVAAAHCASYADVVQLVPEYQPQWNAGSPADTPRWRRGFWREYPPRLERQTRVISTFFHNTRSAAQGYHRARADRRGAAALLAARMYQLDHNGAPPSTWDHLVPAYLPLVPADPFAPSAAPLTLLRRDGGGLIVYSIGKNIVDDRGAQRDRRGRPVFIRGTESADLVYAFPPESPANAQ